jgi:hypothetical protein
LRELQKITSKVVDLRSKKYKVVLESANFVSLRFCVLDNNIMDIECVLSCAGFSVEEKPGRIFRPGVAG